MKTKILVLLASIMMVATCLSLSGCSMCDHVFVDEVIAPTCTQRGYTMRTCTLCSIIVTEDYVPSTGHVYSGEGVVVEPTCTQAGYTQYKCSSCNESVQADFVIALGHDYSIVQQIKAPTCTEEGLSEYACGRCGKHENKTEDALGHNYDDAKEIGGYRVTVCGRCNENVKELITYTIIYDLKGGSAENPTEYTVLTDTFTLQAPTKGNTIFLGWTWSGQSEPVTEVTIQKGSTGNRAYVANWHSGECTYHVLNGTPVTGKYLDASTPGLIEFSGSHATCITTGKGMFVCEACGNEIFTETTKDHALDFSDVREYIVEPTCDTPGKGMVYCSTCNQTIESEIPATGHDFDSKLITKDGKAILVLTCKICGDVQERVIEKCSDYIPATCNNAGSITYSCVTEEGETLSITLPIEKTAHVLNGAYVGNSILAGTKGVTQFGGSEATCSKEGKGMFTCDICKNEIFVVTYKEHTFMDGTVEVIEPATCEKDGKVKGFCSECQLTVEANVLASHSYKYTVTVNATQTEVGIVTVTCQSEGCEFTVECYLPKLTSASYEKTTLENGFVQYAYNLHEYGITVYIIG